MYGEIVRVFGPVPCGMCPDEKMFKEKLVSVLLAQETLLCDNRYRHTHCITEVKKSDLDKSLHRRDRAHYETCNARFKQYNIVGQMFRHRAKLNGRAIHAVVCFVALSLRHVRCLFQLCCVAFEVKC